MISKLGSRESFSLPVTLNSTTAPVQSQKRKGRDPKYNLYPPDILVRESVLVDCSSGSPVRACRTEEGPKASKTFGLTSALPCAMEKRDPCLALLL